MDQLKLVLEYKFWILVALALLLPPIGWWMATGNLAAETEQRKRTIKGEFDSVPDASKDPSRFPNVNWSKAVQQVDEKLTAQLDQSHERLFERQRPYQKWPEMVAKALEKANVKYRGENSSKAFLDAKQFFVARYDDDWLKTVDAIEPFMPETATGKVLVDYKNITRAPVSAWTEMLFSGTEMWDVQEDLWLLKELVSAIAQVNQGATDIGEAPIKKLTEMILRGGSRADLGIRKQTKAARANFDPDDIFGADGSTPMGADRDKRDRTTKKEAIRYVDAIAGKWATRGFVLKVVMDEHEIPKFIAVLSESKFPVEIRHLEHRAYQFGAGKEGALIHWTDLQGPAAAAPGTANTERQKIQARINSALDVAFNQNYLADVIIAGTFTIYDRPPSSAKAPPIAAVAVPPAQPDAKGQPATAAKAESKGKSETAAKGSKTNPSASPPSAAAKGKPAANQLVPEAGKVSPSAKTAAAPQPTAAPAKTPQGKSSAAPPNTNPDSKTTKGAPAAGR